MISRGKPVSQSLRVQNSPNGILWLRIWGCILRSRFLPAWDTAQEGPVISVCEHNDEGETWRSHSGAAEYSSLLECFGVSTGKEFTTFWGTVAPVSWGLGSRLQLKCDGTRWRMGREVKGKLANGVGSQYPSHYLGTWCIQHYYSWCANLGCQYST